MFPGTRVGSDLIYSQARDGSDLIYSLSRDGSDLIYSLKRVGSDLIYSLHGMEVTAPTNGSAPTNSLLHMARYKSNLID